MSERHQEDVWKHSCITFDDGKFPQHRESGPRGYAGFLGQTLTPWRALRR